MTNPKLRRGRYSETDAYYAITTVIHDRRPLFLDDNLAATVIAWIEFCEEGRLLESCAWVVMPDHLHWMFRFRADDLSHCLQAFKSRTARAINQASGMHGPVWQPGFYDHRLRNNEDLQAQARYIVANPMRRGLVERIEDYPFWWCRWIRHQSDL